MPKNNFGPCPKLVNRNELYAGVLVWNRQRFIKDPNTGKRVSRPNPGQVDQDRGAGAACRR